MKTKQTLAFIIADEKGTGKHSHKDSEEPYPHHEAPTARGESGGSHAESSHSSSYSSSVSGSERENRPESHEADLKEREYRDKESDIHHHTHTSEAMKSGNSQRERK
jgi:hypothetical protein